MKRGKDLETTKNTERRRDTEVDVKGVEWGWREWSGRAGNGVGVDGMEWEWRDWSGC